MTRRKNAVAVVEATPVAVPDEAGTLLAVIERATRDETVDVDKMERLLQMHERIVGRQAQAAYAADLAAMQPELPIIEERGNAAGRYKFAFWEDIVGQITPVLSRHGFSLSFRTESASDSVTVTGVLAHRLGHSEQTKLTLPLDVSGNKNAVQALGSSTSYGKRYTAAALLNLRTGERDDDGVSATEPYIDDEQLATLEALASEVGADVAKFCAYMKVGDLAELRASQYSRAVKALEAKRRAA